MSVLQSNRNHRKAGGEMKEKLARGLRRPRLRGTLAALAVGVVLFSRIEKTFMDTV